MVDFNKLISGLGQSGLLGGVAGGVASGAVISGLSSKKGRKAASTMLKVGGVAAAGALAWKAYQHYRQDRPQAAADIQMSSPQLAVAERSSEKNGMLVMRSMIAAAMADGHLSPHEHSLIFERVAELELDESEKSLLIDEMRLPKSPETLAESVEDLETALQVYAAARLVIDIECRAGEVHHDRLARALRLPAELIEAIENEEELAEAATA